MRNPNLPGDKLSEPPGGHNLEIKYGRHSKMDAWVTLKKHPPTSSFISRMLWNFTQIYFLFVKTFLWRKLKKIINFYDVTVVKIFENWSNSRKICEFSKCAKILIIITQRYGIYLFSVWGIQICQETSSLVATIWKLNMAAIRKRMPQQYERTTH